MAEPAKLSQVMDYFNPKQDNGKRVQSISDFNKEWQALPPKDQEHVKQGIGNGTLTY